MRKLMESLRLVLARIRRLITGPRWALKKRPIQTFFVRDAKAW
jgi:hypothetical protein